MRKLFIAALVISVLSVGGFAAYRFYKIWKQDHALKLARQFVAKGDLNNALLSVRQALIANPSNLEANRIMADFAELARSPQALFWRKHIVDLEPDSLTNRLLLARTALAMGDAASATNSLAGVDEAGKKTSAYQKLAGAAALAANRPADAEGFFLEAARLEPTNPVPRLNLAMLQLRRTDTNIAEAARLTLRHLSTNAQVRSDALRELTTDALRLKQTNRALGYVQDLLRQTNSTFADRLLNLNVLRAAQNPRLAPELTALQRESATNMGQVFELSRWMMAGVTPRDTLVWLQTLQPQIRTNLPVAIVVADCYTSASDWAGLQKILEKQHWGDLEYLRLTYRTRALREQNFATAAKAEWTKVMKGAEGRLDRLMGLQQVAANWNWPVEEEEILWAVVNAFPGEQGATQRLSQLLYVGGQTRSLLTLYAKLHQRKPDNLSVKNNLASIALLLDASEHKPHLLAREVFEKEPANPFFASTYAYSLHLQKKTAEAVKVMNQLKPELLQTPGVSGYYALLLAASGDKTGAKKYFDLAAKGPRLPEETELFRRAQAGG